MAWRNETVRIGDNLSMETRLDILRWDQATDWQSYKDAARRLDKFGYGRLWASDHFYAIPAMPTGGSSSAAPGSGAWAKAMPRDDAA